MPDDATFLRQAIQRGHLCPVCRQTLLERADGDAICPMCGTNWTSFRDLFESGRAKMGWADDAWEAWIAGNASYQKGE